MNPLLPLAIGIGFIGYAVKKLADSGTESDKAKTVPTSLTDDENSANLSPVETETKTEPESNSHGDDTKTNPDFDDSDDSG